MKLRNTWINRMLVAAAVIGSTGAHAQSQSEDIKVLLDRIQALEQKVKILERKDELSEESAVEKSRTTPTVTIDSSGLRAHSGDSNFVFALHGVLQTDNRTFFRDGNVQGNDGFLLRRARPIFQGTPFHDFDFLFVPDFAGSATTIFDAYVNYRYSPGLQFRAGKMKSPVGLEQLQADATISFNERALPTSLVPNRDVGFQLWGDLAGGRVSYAVGVFNGVGDARSTANVDIDDNREFAGRLFFQPFKLSRRAALQGFGFGLGASFGDNAPNAAGLSATTGGTLPGYATDGQQQFFAYNPTTGVVSANGTHWRLSPQGYYYFGPFGLLGEYVISHQAVSRSAAPLISRSLEHTAWQVTASWVLTGEEAGYNGVTPRHPFNPRQGDWGALQLVARYAELDIDNDTFPYFANPGTSASAAESWSVGLNWYLNRNVRLNASYSQTTFRGGGGVGATPPATTTTQPEQVFFTRLQLAF